MGLTWQQTVKNLSKNFSITQKKLEHTLCEGEKGGAMTIVKKVVRRLVRTPQIVQRYPDGLVIEVTPSGVLKIRPKWLRAEYQVAVLDILQLYQLHR